MFVWDNGQYVLNNNPITWVTLALTVVLLVAAGLLLFRFLRRQMMAISYGVEAGLLLLSWLFGLKEIWFIVLGALVVSVIVFITVNISEVRPYLSNTLSVAGEKKRGSGKVFDRHALYVKIDTAVQQLSKTRTGAIITFERNVELTDVVKSGTLLNSPITPELLLTIFYPGTRLHDGAVVIRKDQILAASVYYTPTTKPLTGKFGSRHRAAIGISEITDSVTVVVSEETGRISLAVAGELIPVNADTFLRTFEDYMFEEDNAAKNE